MPELVVSNLCADGFGEAHAGAHTSSSALTVGLVGRDGLAADYA